VCGGIAGVQHKQGRVSGDAAVEARSAQEEKGTVLDTLAHGEKVGSRGGCGDVRWRVLWPQSPVMIRTFSRSFGIALPRG